MISANTAEFDAQLERIATEMLEDLYSRVMRKLALDIFARLVRLTPRDTGRAQFGWDISVEVASSFVPPEGAKKYPTNDIARALGALQTLRFGDDVWIVNNVIYIQALNDGHSDQIPAGFIESALEAVLSVFDRAA